LPTYEYQCNSCDENFDVVQSFHDDPLDACPTCGAPVRKVFGNVGIVFKGSGFYKTDSRKASSAKSQEGAASVAASDSGANGSESGPDSKTSSTPNGASPSEVAASPAPDAPAKPKKDKRSDVGAPAGT
jgi:putative FmdB family regulatory protein